MRVRVIIANEADEVLQEVLVDNMVIPERDITAEKFAVEIVGGLEGVYDVKPTPVWELVTITRQDTSKERECSEGTHAHAKLSMWKTCPYCHKDL